MFEHFVQFYDKDTYLISQVSGFIRTGLTGGDTAVVVATKPHLEQLEKHLSADITRAAARYSGADQYITLDAVETLSKFMNDGRPDEVRFNRFFEPLFEQAIKNGNGRVRVFGEMVSLLCEEGRHDAAIDLEKLWCQLAARYPFSLFCAYRIRAFPKQEDGDPFLRICNVHSRIGPAESYTPPTNAHEHYRTIALLQQKAAALETEVAQRREVGNAL